MRINKILVTGISISLLTAVAVFLPLYFVLIPKEITTGNPIVIWDDEDFLNYDFSGLGTKENPYILENEVISTTSSHGIQIANTKKHFVIQNCVIISEKCGIYIENAATGTISIITNTVSSNGLDGIQIIDSDNCTIVENDCNYNQQQGIFLQFCRYSSITDNNCSKNGGEGLVIIDCSYSNISNNICYFNSKNGLAVVLSERVNMTNNSCQKNILNGVVIADSLHTFVANNTLTNNGDKEHPDVMDAILVLTSPNTSIVNNNCSNNADDGISINDSPYCSIEENICEGNNDRGVGLVNSSYTLIQRNGCSKNYDGIRARYSDHLTIIDNSCSDSINGVSLFSPSYCNISFNTIQRNNNFGFVFAVEAERNSENNTIHHNTITENTNYGIYLLGSRNNTVHHNVLINNKISSTSQAYDSTENCKWYDETTMEGNYWSDWIGVGSYEIDGEANAEDLYPLSTKPIEVIKSIFMKTLVIESILCKNP